DRFSFGRNWKRYAATIDEERIRCSVESMAHALGDIRGRSFLDVGCGSGIHVVSALRLGASRVHAFDYDQDSVECSRDVVAQYAPEAMERTTIERGDALSEPYMRSLGTFEVVYSWGVLHHTGDMWRALHLATLPLAPDGRLLLAIYNDQSVWSNGWRAMKWLYVRAAILRPLIIVGVFGPRELAKCMVKTPSGYIREWRAYSRLRGMNRWHDIIDWAGGYPFQVASPAAIREFFARLGLDTLVTVDCGRGNGCNEFRIARPHTPPVDPTEPGGASRSRPGARSLQSNL
ncbi:MAG TPA: class I SAM-dependent methyltransferase, partial [Vicinamibacterales bacterium]|nr:class I SAM-dependent methyltransferase [Vicinamibacterales bacterium]